MRSGISSRVGGFAGAPLEGFSSLGAGALLDFSLLPSSLFFLRRNETLHIIKKDNVKERIDITTEQKIRSDGLRQRPTTIYSQAMGGYYWAFKIKICTRLKTQRNLVDIVSSFAGSTLFHQHDVTIGSFNYISFLTF